VVVGLWHGTGIIDRIPGFGGGGITGLLSVGVIVSVALIPFFAFKEIGRVFGVAALQTLIFKRGLKDVIIEFKLRVQEGD
jgi:hypothetical protein